MSLLCNTCTKNRYDCMRLGIDPENCSIYTEQEKKAGLCSSCRRDWAFCPNHSQEHIVIECANHSIEQDDE